MGRARPVKRSQLASSSEGLLEHLNDQAMHRICGACLNVFLRDGTPTSFANDSHLVPSSWTYLLAFLVVQLDFQELEASLQPSFPHKYHLF